ncbi:unnamed protein product [Fusarium graminearum]|uniref:Xylanolytic transcriptional activator regulatory domain-containing protein n=1 Tax=Gibberella zeae TaxID=5518 RepID=A0A4U9F6H4_GIBZA|nr:unnamed protein product [Fusarium graminearum]CAF3593657.1 unnamed protein product [Fusarium graminearum]CAG1980315.1 unnamed protein product [Fusarium graminearum]CAG1980368.1 unnamed protein product [Fusarium graminearum]CAG2004322.1 unnamed protein product [Fusarium graminearum]
MDDEGQFEANRLGGGPDWPPGLPESNRRACDACRARKVLQPRIIIAARASSRLTYFQVRCDRESPCFHCINAKIACVYTPIQPPKKRTRILLTPQYERKIDLIDNKLAKAIGLLEKLQVGGSSNESPQPAKTSWMSTETPLSLPTPASHSSQPRQARGQVVEGESSLTAHSAFANEFLQKVAATDSIQQSSPELSETLDELSDILTQQGAAIDEAPYPHARPIQPLKQPQCEMPPLKTAIALIRIAKAKELVGSGWIYEFLPFQRFTDMCLDVYFNDNHSEANFITVNAGLYSLFRDYIFHVSAQEREAYTAHSILCRDNLETALSNLPLHLPATTDMILALVFGAFYAIELSKPSLSWTLTVKASELCQTNAYHRLSSMENDKSEDSRYKQFLFWSIYFIDKSLSLRLGRPSTIPDWDITIPRPSINDAHSEPVSAYFVLWIETARCQGNIYEMLYSPNAMAQSDQVKQSRVEALLSDLHQLETTTLETNTIWLEEAKKSSGEDLVNFFYVSDNVLRLSLLTLVHRAAPRLPGSATTFNSDCIAAARTTLQKHEECIALIQRSATPYLATYMHWTLLFAPFIPFIVIFCHVIETQNESDLARLQAFVTSIQSATSISRPAARLHRLFQTLCKIALSYIKFHSTTPADNRQYGSKIDSYLDALGFSSASGGNPSRHDNMFSQQNSIVGDGAIGSNNAGTSVDGVGDEFRVINPMMWMGNSMELEEWLENSEVMAGLI